MVARLVDRKKTSLLIQTCRKMSSDVLSGREVTIPVPWGVIAGKEWGPASSSGVPWIVLHGWLDNAGSFDTLAPLFPAGHKLLCLDYPGHGHSSPLPAGQVYHYLESLSYIQRVASHMGWDRFGLVGHSMGAGMCSLYAATFPEHVQALIMIDLVKPSSRRLDEVVERTRNAVQSLLSIEKKLKEKPDKVYKTEEEALNRLLESANFMHGENAVTEESARTILKRGLKPSCCGSGFVYTRDLRHRIPSLYGLPPEFLEQFAKNIKCPHLLIKATGSQDYDSEELIQKILEIYSDNPNYQFATVEGSHHVHLNSPHLVAPEIGSFISKHVKQE
eukprot:GFUD01019284.1.p1 GENE.GFUD01019284.1~~GFUD01019284.1.p1  ORF type:complete len:332 (-),score=109.14 GFUD01019284.1:206-1201(-)